MKPDRRTAITTVLAGGVTLGLGELASAGHQEDAEGGSKFSDDFDRLAVKAAGFTDAEADCWRQLAVAAGKFFELPELHPMDKEEVANATHIIQNKLLSRPTYRTYVAETKRLRGE